MYKTRQTVKVWLASRHPSRRWNTLCSEDEWVNRWKYVKMYHVRVIPSLWVDKLSVEFRIMGRMTYAVVQKCNHPIRIHRFSSVLQFHNTLVALKRKSGWSHKFQVFKVGDYFFCIICSALLKAFHTFRISFQKFGFHCFHVALGKEKQMVRAS